MVMTIGNGVLTGLNAGGLPDGSVTQPDLANPVAGNGPAFRSTLTVGQSISNSTWTKVQLATKVFDTANCFDNSTNYRFTPNVAGYYLITATVSFGSPTTGWALLGIRKNGGDDNYSPNYPGTANGIRLFTSALMYLNGSTDFTELYVYQLTGSAQTTSNNNADMSFSGALVRAA